MGGMTGLFGQFFTGKNTVGDGDGFRAGEPYHAYSPYAGRGSKGNDGVGKIVDAHDAKVRLPAVALRDMADNAWFDFLLSCAAEGQLLWWVASETKK
jgi:hypothetical protein